MLKLTLDYPTQLYAYVGIPAQYAGAGIQPGLYDVDIYTEGYAHLVGIGWARCPPPVPHTCYHYRDYLYTLCRWQLPPSICELCLDCCLSRD